MFYPLFFLTIIAALLALLSCLIAASTLFSLIITRVPYAPVPKKVLPLIMKTLEIKPGQVVYDLGCGDARFLIEAEKYGACTIGFEVSPLLYLKAKLNIARRHSETQVYFKNFYKEDVSNAQVVYCFLVASVMKKYKKFLENQLRKGTKIVSYGFQIPGWQPVKVLSSNPRKPKASKIYFYVR